MSVPYVRLAAFYFAYYGALGAFSPYFGPFLQVRGLEPWQISVVMSLWYATRMLAPPFWGAATAHSRRPILWLRAGAVATLAGFALFLLPLEFGWIVVVMCVFSSFYNAILPQFEALTLAHLSRDTSRYGRIRVWGSIGFVLANLSYGAALGMLGYGWLALLMLPALAGLVLSTWVNSDSQPDAPLDQANPGFRASVLPLLHDRVLWVFLGATILMQIAHGPFYVFFSVYLGENGYSAQSIGAFWAVGVGAEIAMFLLVPTLLARVSAQRLILGCFAIGVLRWLVTATLPDSVIALVLAQCAHAFTFAAFHGATIQTVSQFFPGRSGVHGQALLYGVGSGVGGVIGALLAGGLWQLNGGSASFLSSAVVSLLGVWLVLRLPLTRPGFVLRRDQI